MRCVRPTAAREPLRRILRLRGGGLPADRPRLALRFPRRDHRLAGSGAGEQLGDLAHARMHRSGQRFPELAFLQLSVPVKGIDKVRIIVQFFVRAAPMATDNPCPRDPEAIRTPGRPSWVVGCPCNLESIKRKVFSSSTGKYPLLASTL